MSAYGNLESTSPKLPQCHLAYSFAAVIMIASLSDSGIDDDVGFIAMTRRYWNNRDRSR